MIDHEGMDEVDKAFVDSLIPDDAIDPELVAVVTWWDPDVKGKRFVAYSAPVRALESVVGALELGKARFLKDHMKETD